MMQADRNMIFDILLLINSENEKRKSSSFSICDLSCQDNHHLKNRDTSKESRHTQTFRQKQPKLYSGTSHQAGENNYFCSGTAQQLFYHNPKN